jgi:probable rRNA maturation factor
MKLRQKREDKMRKINLIVENRQNLSLPFGIKNLLKKALSAVLEEEGLLFNAEVNLSFVSPEEIKTLNSEYRNKPKETDVLSFPLGENGEYPENPENGDKLLGDIVISVSRAYSQAETFGHSKKREICFLAVHSMLHLLGYDHELGDKEDKEMREKQTKILEKLRLGRGK